LALPECAHLRAAAGTVKFSTLRDHIQTVAFTSVEVLATR